MFKRSLVTESGFESIFGAMEELGFFREKNLSIFNSANKEFSAENAWWMAELSRLSYVQSEDKIEQILKEDAGAQSVKFFNDKETGTFAFIVDMYDQIVVVFRGTEMRSTADIKTDLNFWFGDSEGVGKVHRGFKNSLDSIWDDLSAELEVLHTDQKHVCFTGHSLGAALAIIAGSRVDDCDQVYTFGAPRVGNKKFVRSIKATVHRVSRSRDIVTRIPPTFIGYRHTGDNWFINANHGMDLNPGFFYMLKERLGGSEFKILWLILMIVVTRNPWNFLKSYLMHHSPVNYSILMWNNIQANK